METILLIDDSRTIRRLVGSSLKKLGFETLEAEDGLQGLEMLATHQVDLVIVDLNMPNLNGLDFTRQVRSQEILRDLPIVMLTTESSEKDRQRGFEAGVNTYLVKPVSAQVLHYKLRSLLDKEE